MKIIFTVCTMCLSFVKLTEEVGDSQTKRARWSIEEVLQLHVRSATYSSSLLKNCLLIFRREIASKVGF